MKTRVIGSLTEIYTDGGGNLLTESFPTNFHHPYTNKILTARERITDYREVTATEWAAIKAEDDVWVEPSVDLITRWNNAGGDDVRYNPNTGYFEANGITDIGTAEAVRTLTRYVWRHDSMPSFEDEYICRTNICQINSLDSLDRSYTRVINLASLFRNTSVEVIRITNSVWGIKPAMINNVIRRNTTKLRAILGPIDLSLITAAWQLFDNNVTCPLEQISLLGAKVSFDISGTSVMSLESVKYMVDNAANTAAITIKVHADVYAKLTDVNNAAWYAVKQAAGNRNISFAKP